ncbi:hypothetical protein AM455_08020 [Klebsiella pneumoniae]|nr:hypothetical protein AM455_08020 [Klebsiella pneumoniae]
MAIMQAMIPGLRIQWLKRKFCLVGQWCLALCGRLALGLIMEEMVLLQFLRGTPLLLILLGLQ